MNIVFKCPNCGLESNTVRQIGKLNMGEPPMYECNHCMQDVSEHLYVVSQEQLNNIKRLSPNLAAEIEMSPKL